jgi:hypothetical protein
MGGLQAGMVFAVKVCQVFLSVDLENMDIPSVLMIMALEIKGPLCSLES